MESDQQQRQSNPNPSGAGGNKKSASSMEYQLKEYLLLLATLVATVTYAAGLNLPGGVWQEDTHGEHLAGKDASGQPAKHKYRSMAQVRYVKWMRSIRLDGMIPVKNNRRQDKKRKFTLKK